MAIEQLQAAIRLMPTNAQAWNHLGLALHHNKQPKEALKAYRQALALDRKLSVVHYNIGCLLLEHGDAAGAIDPLTSYTYLQPRSAQGWLKLATAQLRARKFDGAEISFKRAVECEPGNAEARNGLGVVQAWRKRPFEALGSFNQALRQDPRYSPAVLNAAVVTYQQLKNPAVALDKLRQYLALQSPSARSPLLAAFAKQLELELSPAPLAVAQTPPGAPTTLSNAPSRPPETVPVINASPALTQAAIASNVIAQPAAPATNPPAPATRTEAVAALVHSLPPKSSPVEVTKISDELVITPAQDVKTSAPQSTVDSSGYIPPTAVPAPTDKAPLISRLNPFGGRPKPAQTPSPAPVRTEQPQRFAAAKPMQPTSPLVARYAYTNPRAGVPGNRAEAIRVLAEGLKTHQAGRPSQAASYYERAGQLDPACFEAHYNLGLALLDSGNARRALGAFEQALALRKDSTDARYNFALALKQANYLHDAADQLRRIIDDKPEDTRAHLALANLYAQKLHDPRRAREHYLLVIEKQPRHPQAVEIRHWLAAHPRG